MKTSQEEVSLDKRMDILHDHYKESFAIILDRERSRNRLFLIVIGLYAFIAVEVQYPTEFGGSLQSLSVGGEMFHLNALPLRALLNATWVLTFAMALRYCSLTVTINRSYTYIHKLEDDLSPMLGGNHRYRREGKEYLDDYPRLLNVAWIAYVFVFPLILVIATAFLLSAEWFTLRYPILHRLLDSTLGVTTALVVFLYFTEPWIDRRWPETRCRLKTVWQGLVNRRWPKFLLLGFSILLIWLVVFT